MTLNHRFWVVYLRVLAAAWRSVQVSEVINTDASGLARYEEAYEVWVEDARITNWIVCRREQRSRMLSEE